ncbi:MAG: holo-[acyl-carrier-protein] synthase [Acidobacteria bacterium]|nr:MAG: holo-[acyl-carrier-protein] synthase [Acidobacteriota bacterium]
MILGLGTDLVDVERFRRVTERHGDGFLERLFSPAEIAACRKMRRPAEQLAARFAAREALLKALGTGLVGPMSWRDIEVLPAGARGVYTVEVRGAVRAEAERLGASRLLLAMTTTREVAAATVVMIE